MTDTPLQPDSPCPQCGGELEPRKHRFSTEGGPNLPDADWLECPDCGWRTEPE